MSERPTRWLDDPDLDETLRGAVSAGRDDLPSADQLASLEAKLGPLLGGGGGPGGAPPPAAPVKLAGLAKGVAALSAVVAAVGVGVVAWPSDPAPAPAPAPPVAPVAEATPEPAPEAVPEGIDPPPLPEPEAPVAPRYETDPTAELALIERAQRSLAGAPAEALQIAREHSRRFGPRATMAQEREVIAVDALHRLGRDRQARARADAFHRRWPGSAHGRRIDVLLGE